MNVLIGNTYYTDISPTMTSNTTPSPYVAECSIVVINALWQAFDGSTDTVFRTNISTVTPFTFSLDYGEGNEQIVNAYRLSCTYNTTWSMKSWDFEGSNDKVSWDVLDSRTNIVWDEQNIQTFAFHNTKKYRYYRFNVIEKNGTNSVCINEIEFLQEKTTNIEFRKVLKRNLPNSKTDGIDTVYFTDDGDIYITDKSGNLILSGVTHISSESDNTLSMKDDGLYAPSYVKMEETDVADVINSEWNDIEYAGGEEKIMTKDTLKLYTELNNNMMTNVIQSNLSKLTLEESQDIINYLNEIIL